MDYTLNNGLNIEIGFDFIHEPDRECGIYLPYAHSWWITHVGTRKCSVKVSDWLRKRMNINTREAIEKQLVEDNY